MSAAKDSPARRQTTGIIVSLASAMIVGWAPIFGKMAYRVGVDPYTLAALRTILAATMLWVFYLVRWRSYIRIDWRNLLGCIGIGAVNGIGSLFYYTGLQRLDASLVSLLNSLYPIWVFIFLSASGHAISRLAVARLALALVGLNFITLAGPLRPDSLGVMLMLASAAAYGWHLVLGQWVLADVHSRTVTLYVLTTMAVVVGGVRLFTPTGLSTPSGLGGDRMLEPIGGTGWEAILGLAIVTALSRLMMFAGLQRLGGAQTALLGITELITTLLVAFIVLGERLSQAQWLGGAIIIASVLLVRGEKAEE